MVSERDPSIVMEVRVKRRRLPLTITTDWLYACPTYARTHSIVAAICAAHPATCRDRPEVTEVVARRWQQPWQMTNDLLDAYGYPAEHHAPKGRDASWDGLNDSILLKAGEPGVTTEVLLIRESNEEAERNLALLVDIVDWRQQETSRIATSHPHLLKGDQYIFLVLAGWPRDTISGKPRGRERVWAVNWLPV